MEINKVAVIGSGVMGSGIAAHIANSDTEVVLLDIPAKEGDKNGIVKEALKKIEKADPEMVTHKRKLKNIEIGNLDDDLGKISDCDWIIEVIVENLDIKKSLYEKLEGKRKKGSVISSNTSTIPLEKLIDGRGEEFRKDFMITHFFNPPRYMRLLELVVGKDTNPESADAIKNFCDYKLGKGVVECYDSPGFIANRVGTFWLTRALKEVVDTGAPIEVADAMMSRPIGVPKTGVFGLMDLIGLDLLPLIAKSFADTLPADDEFNKIYAMPPVMEKLIADGYTGRKGKGGFYRLNPDAPKGVKEKQSVDLKTGEYSKSEKPRLNSAKVSKKSLALMVEEGDEGSKFVWPVLRDLLVYTANLVGEIADEVKTIDEAMRLGYNWKYGPFELIDKFVLDGKSGAVWFASKCEADGVSVPEIIKKVGSGSFYKVEDGKRYFFAKSGEYQEIPFDETAFMLSEIKLRSKPIIKNGSAALWDIGDGVTCFEFTSKMNSLDPMTLELLAKATEETKKNYKAMVVYNDSDNFCVGANIGVLLFAANVAAWKEIDGIIKQGQDAYMGLKYAPFPVVGAPSGMALGGGCEILLHCDAVQAHCELYTGLVEVGVGLVPGWGGCKEMMYRELKNRAESDMWAAKLGGWFSWLSPIKTLNAMPALVNAMTNISTARVSKSAEQAKNLTIINNKSGITMNRGRLLADAKKKALSMVEGYQVPETYNISLPGKTGRTAIEMKLKDLEKTGQATPYDMVVSRAVAQVLTGGETDITEELTEQQMLDLERTEFVKLVKNKGTLDRIEHMLNTGKPLRN